MFQNATNVHGGKPNCRCVPNPAGLGRKFAAISNRLAAANPKIANPQRSSRVSLLEFRTIGWVTCKSEKEPESS